MQPEALLMRAGSWQAQGEAMLLKTASDVMAQVAGLQGPKGHKLLQDGHEGGKTNSVDSSSTAAGQQSNAHHLVDSATAASLLPPLRQISLDVIAATELNRAKGLAPERQNIFQDVFEQLAGKEELPPVQPGLYTLPSMQFLENMLSDFDSKSGSNTAPGLGLPLDLPSDAFDLPDFNPHLHHHHQQLSGAGSATAAAAALRPTPFDQQHHQQQQHHQLLHHQRHHHPQVAAHQQQHIPGAGYGYAAGSMQAQQPAGYSSFVPLSSAPAALQAQHMAPSMHSSSMSVRAHSAYAPGQVANVVVAPAPFQDAEAHHHHLLALQQQQAAAVAAAQRAQPSPAAVRQPAVPQPQQPRATPRRASQAYADFEYEQAEVSLQTSKSGRVRKVASFTGIKRRLDVAGHSGGAHGNTVSESRDSRGSVGGADVSSGEVGSKGSKGARKTVVAKGRKGRRTVCLNCGCHQTPQWRCGPLGPRTLCNACGVRYKKDLPLNCWPIRDGMVLPPGAVLPPGFVVPPGITIHTQPAENE